MDTCAESAMGSCNHEPSRLEIFSLKQNQVEDLTFFWRLCRYQTINARVREREEIKTLVNSTFLICPVGKLL